MNNHLNRGSRNGEVRAGIISCPLVCFRTFQEQDNDQARIGFFPFLPLGAVASPSSYHLRVTSVFLSVLLTALQQPDKQAPILKHLSGNT